MESRDVKNYKICTSITLGKPAMSIPFLGYSNIWIKNTYQSQEIRLAQEIIIKALNETSIGQLSIIGYDEDLSGLFAPFFSLASGGSRKLLFIENRKQLADQFSYFRRHIQDVQNLIQGRAASLLEFNQHLLENNEVISEGFVLTCFVMNIESLSDEMQSELSRFLRVGPRFGLSFLIISPSDFESHGYNGADIRIDASMLFPNIAFLQISDSGNLNFNNQTSYLQFMPMSSAYTITNSYMEKLAAFKIQSVEFRKIQDIDSVWTKSSVDGLTFCIGKYGMENMEITIGDEKNQRHNAVITGAVGTGKSNLLSVIIHSLCLNYSPRELQLYLLDFKEGVSLKAFSNIDHEDYLPHVKAIGLESDISFGQSVLEKLFDIYLKRMKLFKEKNIKSIREFRIAYPNSELPRILVIIDEFQMMFDDGSNQSRSIAKLLEKSMRLFRAAGIHFLLASQSLGGNQALNGVFNSLFSQIPIRIALKNSESESMRTLGVNNPYAAYIRPREAIINVDYGELSQNKKTAIAFADDRVLSQQRKKWWQRAKCYTKPPYVFELSRTTDISNFVSEIINHRDQSAPVAFLGERVSVDCSAVTIPMTREKGRNIALFGLPDMENDTIEGMIQGICISLAGQYPKGNIEFLICDFAADIKRYSSSMRARHESLFSIIDRMGFSIETIEPNLFEERLEELCKLEEDDFESFVLGINMDKAEIVAQIGKENGVKKFLEKGAQKGRHFIGWWQKTSTLKKQIGTGNDYLDNIATKVFFRIDEQSVQSIISPYVHWRPVSNRALVSSPVDLQSEITMMPFIPIGEEKEKAILTIINS